MINAGSRDVRYGSFSGRGRHVRLDDLACQGMLPASVPWLARAVLAGCVIGVGAGSCR
jgi:hypothetical protein